MNSFLIDWNIQSQDRSRISKKGVQMCKGVGGVLLILSHFS